MKTKLLPYLLFMATSLCACSRSGTKIYAALFGEPSEKCVKVIQSTDQLVPRIDCCIWLEFSTCPKELKRIAGKQPYEFKRYAAADTFRYTTVMGAEPAWWKPYLLGDSVCMLTDLKPEDPNHAHFLLFSKDSTRAFYCDMAD